MLRYVFTALMIAGSAYGQPSITGTSGTVADGNSVTITGTGFGTKSPAAPVLWDRVGNIDAYSGLSDGDVIPTGSGYPWEANSTWGNDVVYDTDVSRGTGSASYMIDEKGYLKGSDYAGDADRLYVNWWFRPSAAIDQGGSNKLIRIWTDTSGDNGRISWTQMHMTYGDGSGGTSWSAWGGDAGVWNCMEILVSSDSVGTAGGVVKAITNGSVRHNVSDLDGLSDYSYLDLIGFDASIQSHYTGYSFSFTDVYIDTTWSRVMLGNSSTMALSTVREVQPATSWSSTSITVDLNAGSFESGDTAYLYVVGNNNAASSGYEVTIGGSGGSQIGTPALTRTGSDLDLTWTAPSTTPDHYVVYVREGGASVARRVGVTTTVNMNNIEVAGTGQVDVYVVAYAADGSVISTSETATDNP